jgi:hypothetical protein
MEEYVDEGGLTLTVTQDEPKDWIPILGGDDSNPTWEEHLNSFKESLQPHIKLIRRAIEDKGWVGETGQSIANHWYFVFSDGVAMGFSWRAWGDLMQAIVGRREGYMHYYM